MVLLRAIVVVIPLLPVIAGDVETNPGPGDNISLEGENVSLNKSRSVVGLDEFCFVFSAYLFFPRNVPIFFSLFF